MSGVHLGMLLAKAIVWDVELDLAHAAAACTAAARLASEPSHPSQVLAWVCNRGPLVRAWQPLQFGAITLAPITPVEGRALLARV